MLGYGETEAARTHACARPALPCSRPAPGPPGCKRAPKPDAPTPSPGQCSYKVIATGQVVFLHPSSVLCGKKPECVVFNELVRGQRGGGGGGGGGGRGPQDRGGACQARRGRRYDWFGGVLNELLRG
jgi:hypothetical protein